MRNTLGDLNNHLFAQMERLSDEELTSEELTKEIERSRAIASISREIVSNAHLIFQAEKLKVEYGHKEVPKMLEG